MRSSQFSRVPNIASAYLSLSSSAPFCFCFCARSAAFFIVSRQVKRSMKGANAMFALATFCTVVASVRVLASGSSSAGSFSSSSSDQHHGSHATDQYFFQYVCNASLEPPFSPRCNVSDAEVCEAVRVPFHVCLNSSVANQSVVVEGCQSFLQHRVPPHISLEVFLDSNDCHGGQHKSGLHQRQAVGLCVPSADNLYFENVCADGPQPPNWPYVKSVTSVILWQPV